jgi:hypothetical protein
VVVVVVSLSSISFPSEPTTSSPVKPGSHIPQVIGHLFWKDSKDAQFLYRAIVSQ